MTDFEAIGGEAGLRAIIADFTATVFSDTMIGFLFSGKNLKRIEELEYQFAARHLGADVVYTGRTIRNAHRSSPIMGGHFMRRRQILVNTLMAHDVPADIAARWIDHVDSLRQAVLGDADPTGCDHDEQRLRTEASSSRGEKKSLTGLPVLSE